MRDEFHAYVNKQIKLQPTGRGSLDKLTFSVKDVFSIKDYASSAGNPDWLRTHDKSRENAPVIEQLLEAGATLSGTTHTDELMYSLNGENYHYGTPVNPKAPNHIPGGSSSGSAVAVAAGDVDFTLGTDTGGSVRIPSSYCGLYGFRPTHGAVAISGVIPLAQSFDTVGWMTKDIGMLHKVGKVLIKDTGKPCDHIIFPEDAWSLLNDKESSALKSVISNLQSFCDNTQSVTLAQNGLFEWAEAFRIIQGYEIWQTHGEWVSDVKPTFGPGIKERFIAAEKISQQAHDEQLDFRQEIIKEIVQVLGETGVLVIPTAPAGAPLRDMPSDQLDERRKKTMQLTCVAGLAGLPQVTLPLTEIDGLPLGISLIANRNQDLSLLKFAEDFVKFVDS
ncbi:amidase [Radiobacillus sp. PE A8.2]|uniref:amidase n=1 Tax=Radiobacillus sp. PE A8.2 TaxID=3380349 RepID=UPI00388D0988